ncbi:MAG: hypothetical protein LBE21_06370 [Pseudomonadales bacterium]|nr:hypothetical protein [Pseudomonadales bacterium]
MTEQWGKLAISVAGALVIAAPAFAQQDNLDISAELMASAVAANGKAADGDEDSDRTGGVAGGSLGFNYDKDADHLNLDLSSTYFEYVDEARIDRWSNDISGTYGRDFTSDLRLSGIASYTSQSLLLESASANQSQLRARLAYSPGPHRIRATGGWRWRDYRDLADGEGEGPTITVDYRYRLGGGRYVSVSARYEEIDSNIDRADHRRDTFTAEYGHRFGQNTDAVFALQWRDWTYPYRTVRGAPREDWRIAPSFFITHDFGDGWTGEFEGLAIYRDSNSAGREQTITRVTLTMRKRFDL